MLCDRALKGVVFNMGLVSEAVQSEISVRTEEVVQLVQDGIWQQVGWLVGWLMGGWSRCTWAQAGLGADAGRDGTGEIYTAQAFVLTQQSSPGQSWGVRLGYKQYQATATHTFGHTARPSAH